jgi:hypothetical protein
MTEFAQVELLFDEFLAQNGSALTESERQEIKEYVDFGEYGIALRFAVAIFREEKKVATANEWSLIQRLAQAMSIDSATLLMV